MEITIIDDSDLMGWAASAFRVGEIHMTSVKTMVKNVLKESEDKKITRLNIVDHGSPKHIQIGNDKVTIKNLHNYQSELTKLTGKFDANGIVHLQHCKIGKNFKFLKRLARIFNVPVFAGTDKHAPWIRFQFGSYIMCTPEGTCSTVARPDTPDATDHLQNE